MTHPYKIPEDVSKALHCHACNDGTSCFLGHRDTLVSEFRNLVDRVEILEAERGNYDDKNALAAAQGQIAALWGKVSELKEEMDFLKNDA